MFEWRTVSPGLFLCTLLPAAWLIFVPGAIASQEFGWMFAAMVLLYTVSTVVFRNPGASDESCAQALSRAASINAARIAAPPTSPHGDAR